MIYLILHLDDVASIHEHNTDIPTYVTVYKRIDNMAYGRMFKRHLDLDRYSFNLYNLFIGILSSFISNCSLYIIIS